MISQDNYEIWIIDYLDGKLTTEQVGQLILFLEKNPDIAEEFDGLAEVKLEDANPTFSKKESLLKEPMDLPMEEVDLLLAKKLEGDLNPEEEKAVDAMISSHEWISRSWSLLQMTSLASEESVFAAKDDLLIADAVDLNNPEMAAIAVAEGDANGSADPALVQMYSSLRVKAEEHLVFADKDGLIQKGAVVSMRTWLIRGAAAAAVILLLWQGWTTTSSSDGTSINGFSSIVNVKDVKEQVEERPVEKYDRQPLQSAPVFVAQTPEKRNIVEPTYDQVSAPMSLASVNVGVIKNSITDPVLAIVDLPEIDPVLYADIHDSPIVPPVDEVPSAIEFIGAKIKQKIWGEGEVPQEDFALALAGKAASRYSERTGANLALSPAENEKEGFSLRLGKLEISRY